MKNLTQARTTSDHYGLCGPGYSCATLKIYRKVQEIFEQIYKNFRSSDYFLQLEDMKKESLVIANQQSCGEYVLELCTHCPSRSGRCLASSWRWDLYIYFVYKFAAMRKLGANWNEVVTR